MQSNVENKTLKQSSQFFMKFKNILENHLVYYPAPTNLFYA